MSCTDYPQSFAQDIDGSSHSLFLKKDDSSSCSSQVSLGESCCCSDCNNSHPKNPDQTALINDLRRWVIDHNVPLNHTSELLKILHRHKINVPLARCKNIAKYASNF